LNTVAGFYVNIRHDSNTQLNFLDCLKDFVAQGGLLRGDILIVDNATVHMASAHFNEILAYLNSEGIDLQSLPTYSPELNPCELVFARIKAYIKSTDAFATTFNGRDHLAPFKELLCASLQTISRDELINMYWHCARPKHR
jgi:transposase